MGGLLSPRRFGDNLYEVALEAVKPVAEEVNEDEPEEDEDEDAGRG